ncbi:MAG: hypothetical protein PHT69_11770 [Bacteroidales bacterium]|nr:hypothetical protein [Bacteroidales bacterium]
MNHFIFVVCGSREHIETLNYSLQFIRHFSLFPILVLTDSKRNEIPIKHDNIIDVNTPEYMDNHQASIYLKTGLHKYLNIKDDDLYCYLDSDIVAINENINTIFANFKEPILFANDHCNINYFSPYSVHCSCLNDTLRRNNEYAEVDNFFEQKFFNQIKLNSLDKLKLERQFEEIKKINIGGLSKSIIYLIKRYLLPLDKFKFGGYFFNKKEHFWYNSNNEIIHFDYPFFAKNLYKKTGIYFDKVNNKWMNRHDEDITPQTPACRHFLEFCEKKYNLIISNNWQHWNGGVFLFNKTSESFLDYWHKITIDEFENSYTKTRDQGTLAITAWKFGLQDSETLPLTFNFIAEFDNPNIAYIQEKGFTNDGFKTILNPCFLHIYHEWGHEGWSIWDYVTQLLMTFEKK